MNNLQEIKYHPKNPDLYIWRVKDRKRTKVPIPQPFLDKYLIAKKNEEARASKRCVTESDTKNAEIYIPKLQEKIKQNLEELEKSI